MAKRHLITNLLLLVLFVTGMTLPVLLRAQAATPVISQEYFIQQAVNEDLLITISAFEAEMDSKISGPNGEVLLLSSMPGSRIVPLFQYIYAPKSGRQLDIEVTSGLHTKRTEFGIELTRLKPWDSRSNSISQAYKLLSFGSETSSVDSQANWTVKIDSLGRAAMLFRQFGMQEMSLWADYLRAHLIQFHLHDHSIVYSMTREILAELKGTRLQKIELATLQLQGLALIGLRKSGSLDLSSYTTDPIQDVLSRSIELAEAMGFHFEQAQALYSSGLEHAEQAFYTNALEQFQKAVQIADSVGSAELANAIRESIVQIHTIQGDAPATSEVLQEIESQLVEEGGGDELALNLLAQARLLMDTFHFGKAYEVLSGALSYENNSAIRKQINFELAKIFYETGRMDESISYLQLADIEPDSDQKRRLNPVVDIGEGLRVMANIHRGKGEYQRMQAARMAQGQYQPAAAQYLYDQGLDAIAQGVSHRQQAASFFRQSQAAASRAGQVDLQHISVLQYCALAGGDDAPCSKAALSTSYEWLLSGGIPRLTTEAMYLWAQMLAKNGQRGEASSVLDRLIDEIHLMRHSLAGGLGAWYWERHGRIFETWIEMLVTDSRPREWVDGSASLLALSKIRYIESYTGSELYLSGVAADTDPLRDLLAQRAKPGAGQSALALNGKINAGLDSLRVSFRRNFEFLSVNGLQKYLRSLENDERVLTYHLSPSMAQVWVVQKGRVQRRDIGNPAEVYRALNAARQDLATGSLAAFNSKMDKLGQYLITPVNELLAEHIYLIPAGPLLGFPVDALRVNGHYLLEKHNVVNLLSFPANTNPGHSLQAGALQKVFLAGNPMDFSGDYATQLETSPEIRAVTDIFVGPGLQIIQGVALLPDEFQGGYFLESNLIHLAMPGIINLKYPFESGLELSESEDAPGRLVLKPADIRSQKLSAGLVFLSSTGFTESPLSGFTSQAGIVSDFSAAGARSVVVNLWSGEAGSDEVFITDFYRSLQASGNIADALRKSRLQYLKNSRDNGNHDWAGYQLFIQ